MISVGSPGVQSSGFQSQSGPTLTTLRLILSPILRRRLPLNLQSPSRTTSLRLTIVRSSLHDLDKAFLSILDVRLVMVGFERRIRSALSAEVAGRLQPHSTVKSQSRR